MPKIVILSKYSKNKNCKLQNFDNFGAKIQSVTCRGPSVKPIFKKRLSMSARFSMKIKTSGYIIPTRYKIPSLKFPSGYKIPLLKLYKF